MSTTDQKFYETATLDVGDDNEMTAAAIVGNYLVIACEKKLFAFDSTTYERMGIVDKSVPSEYGIYGMIAGDADTVMIAGQGGNL